MIIPFEVLHLIVSKYDAERKSTQEVLRWMEQQDAPDFLPNQTTFCGIGHLGQKNRRATANGFKILKSAVGRKVENMALCNDYLHRLTQQ
uniref:Uncharacterized protein n=1 Tax=Clandestinovirus TaxID=2831644 RepID=A0A8F8KP83_9VIRU|nr:hypothetical protein KOM_12_493 [Clandestinovirus]